MKVLMIGTPTCIKCKSIAPKLQEYCDSHNIEYEYRNITEAGKDVTDILVAKKITSAPAFLIYRGEETLVISGDDIFLELGSL